MLHFEIQINVHFEKCHRKSGTMNETKEFHQPSNYTRVCYVMMVL